MDCHKLTAAELQGFNHYKCYHQLWKLYNIFPLFFLSTCIVVKVYVLYEIVPPTNAPKYMYNFILKSLLHVSALVGHLQGE
jgi:hypothetical protein